jgi:sarcosine oxidase subunit delta
MRIPCPDCGERDSREFVYLGDAAPARPDANAADARVRFFEYVYLRENIAGVHEELWYHASGCRTWLIVRRNTLTHEISAASRAAEAPRPEPRG